MLGNVTRTRTSQRRARQPASTTIHGEHTARRRWSGRGKAVNCHGCKTTGTSIQGYVPSARRAGCRACFAVACVKCGVRGSSFPSPWQCGASFHGLHQARSNAIRFGVQLLDVDGASRTSEPHRRPAGLSGAAPQSCVHMCVRARARLNGHMGPALSVALAVTFQSL